MAKYHLKPSGDPGKCNASAGNCPFGSPEEHFPSEQDARTHYETVASKKHGYHFAPPATRSAMEEPSPAAPQLTSPMPPPTRQEISVSTAYVTTRLSKGDLSTLHRVLDSKKVKTEEVQALSAQFKKLSEDPQATLSSRRHFAILRSAVDGAFV